MKFRLVDKIISCESGVSIVAVKAVSFEEYSLRGVMGMVESLPESLAIGAMFETASWLTILSTGFAQIAWPEQIDACRISARPSPGEQMRITARVLERDASMLCFAVEATIAGQQAIMVPRLSARLLALSDYYDPDDLRTLYGEIGAHT